MEDMKEFVAYARKLLRVINKIEKYLENGESEKALELVRELKEDTHTQFPDGGCYHQYQPLTKRGNNDIGGGFNDDLLLHALQKLLRHNL